MSKPLIPLIQIGLLCTELNSNKASLSFKNFKNILNPKEGFIIKQITPQQIRKGALMNLKAIIIGGGSAKAQTRSLGKIGENLIKEFIQNGGGYIGICAGAYYAQSINIINTNLLFRKISTRIPDYKPFEYVNIKLTDTGQKFFNMDESEKKIYYSHTGTIFAQNNKSNTSPYVELATFTSITNEKKIMLNATAILKSDFGKGKVVCFGPHPENHTLTGKNLLIKAVDWVSSHRQDQP